MSSTVRIPGDIYETLRQIKIELESQHQSAAPTMQDLISVALERFIKDLEDPEIKKKLIPELLKHRKIARSRMGKRKSDSTELDNQ